MKDQDFAGLKKAITYTHTLWGGRFNPVVPISDLALGKQLVKLFRIDTLIPTSTDPEISEFIKLFTYLPKPFIYDELFVKDSSFPFATVLDISNPVHLLNQARHTSAKDMLFKLYEWDSDDPLALILLALFGQYPPGQEIGIDYPDLIENYLEPKRIKIGVEEAIPNRAPNDFTCNKLTTVNLQSDYSNYGSDWSNPGFYIGSAAEFSDIVNYWNLRAANINLMFYDPNVAIRFEQVKNSYVEMLSKQHKASRFREGIPVWSQSRSQFKADAFGNSCTFSSVESTVWNGLNLQVPTMHFSEKTVLASIGNLQGKLNMTCALPEKPCETNVKQNWNQNLVASIKSYTSLNLGERLTFQSPFIPELNEYLGRNLYFEWNKVRVEPGGIGIIIDLWHDVLTFRALEITQLISKVFETAGIQAQISQAGLIASRLIQQLGGLQGCRAFKITGIRKLIEKYGADQVFTKSAATQIIRQIDPGTGKPNFNVFESLYIEQRHSGTKLKPSDVLTYLTRNNIFRVGLEFHCPNCELNFWQSLDEIKTETKCEYCGSFFNVNSQLSDRDWKYRRSGLFGKDNHQEGAIPTVVTLQQIDTNLFGKQLLYSTSMILEHGPSNKYKCETDFVAISQQGKTQIAIGECKNRGRIDENDTTNLVRVAKCLEEKGFEVFIIFSKFEDFTDQELKICATVNEQYIRRLILFTKRELEPYSLYERTEKEFEIPYRGISFKYMAEVTNAVFYDKRRKAKSE